MEKKNERKDREEKLLLALDCRNAANLGEKCDSNVPSMCNHGSEQKEISFISVLASILPSLKSS